MIIFHKTLKSYIHTYFLNSFANYALLSVHRVTHQKLDNRVLGNNSVDKQGVQKYPKLVLKGATYPCVIFLNNISKSCRAK